MSETLTELLTSKEVARILHCAPKSIRKWAKSKKIPVACIIGGDYRFNPNSIRAWMAKTRGEE